MTYKDVIGKREIQLGDDPPISLGNFLEQFAAEIGGELGSALFDRQSGRVGRSVAIMLNGRHANHLEERLDTVLKDQDEIAVFPPAAGG